MNQAGKRRQYPMSNKEYPRMKDRGAVCATPALEIGDSLLVIGDSSSPRIEIGAEPEGGEIVLFVRDNGKGIDPRHRSKLFGLFEKLDPNAPGSGMGLARVRSIVKMHGGKIHAQSDGPGKGTAFRFTLAKTELRRPA